MKESALNNRTLFFLILIIVSAFLLRCYAIDLRPFHHDEGVNYHFLREMVNRGYYPYLHENYHGPFYFYFAQFIRWGYGDSELSIRMPSIIAGTGICLLPMFFLSRGVLFVLVSALLLAISPSMIFHSRYAIHEMTFVFLSLWFGFSIFKYFESRESKLLIHIAVSLALLIATKETFIITGFAIFMGLLVTFGPIAFLKILKESSHDIVKSLILFTIILLGTFSAGFRWFNGIREMFLAVPQWISRNTSDTGHFKPFAYYAEIILKTEPWLFYAPAFFILVLSILFILSTKNKKYLEAFRSLFNDTFLRFIFVWSIIECLVYGYVKYKTPWLIINQTGPLVILTGYLLVKLINVFANIFTTVSTAEKQSLIVKRIGCLVIFVIAIFSLINSYTFNIKIPYGNNNPYSYVHTSSGIVRMLEDIESYRKRIPTARVLIGVKSYWPLPYYIRKYEKRVVYQTDANPGGINTQYDVMILDKTATWEHPDWVKKYYRMSDVQESLVYYRLRPTR